ncbi:MAG: Hsp20/alpha crystallin family protein [Acholeplasmatales bacterium]|nr:Hsp20/alpha crystallin family protein [Acholeplasmatales bacterium]
MFDLRNYNYDFNDFFGLNGFNGNADLEETNEGYILTMEVPGIAKENINIDLEDDVLTVSVKQDNEEKNENKYLRHEIVSQYNFSRGFQVEDADMDNVAAKLENGILTVLVKKKITEKPLKKTISIE